MIDANLMKMQSDATLFAAQAKGRQLDAKAADPSETKAFKDFEAFFVSQMLQPMFESVGEDNYLSGGFAEGMFKTMLVDEFGKLAARTGKLGVADAVRRQMLIAQENANIGQPAAGTEK